jgi:hypothetical protein
VHVSTGMLSIWGCTCGCWPCGHSPQNSVSVDDMLAIICGLTINCMLLHYTRNQIPVGISRKRDEERERERERARLVEYG